MHRGVSDSRSTVLHKKRDCFRSFCFHESQHVPSVAFVGLTLCCFISLLLCSEDIPFLERYVARHPLRSRRLKLRRVPRSRVLRVPHTHSTDLSGDTLRLYFKAELNVDVIVEAKASAMEVEFPSTESEL